ncbi:MAG: hypothetical protein ACRC6E_05200, partial [Fusobacteriaceae bacterium]
CSYKIDSNGFYMEGKNIGIHKETKTKYDKDGFDRYGWSSDKNINKETKTEYDKNGYNYYKFNKYKINKDTGTNYDIEGWDINQFNEQGINKKTGFSFDSDGNPKYSSFYESEILAETFFSKPYVNFVGLISSTKTNYFQTYSDKFTGTKYIGRSYNSDLCLLATMTSTAKLMMEIAQETKKKSDYSKAYEQVDNVLKTIKGKFYIDIITNYDQNKKVTSYFTFTFFTPKKQYNSESVELLIDGNIFTIDNYIFNSNNIEYHFSLFNEKLPLYFNQVKIPLTDKLFNLFAKMEKDKEIEARVLTDEDNRFKWVNQMDENKGLATGLGKHYKIKNNSK